MVRSLVAVGGAATPSLQTKVTSNLFFSSFRARPNSFLFSKNPQSSRHACHLWYRFRAICSCNHGIGRNIDMSEYKAAFAKRMAMGGLTPHQRIAVGVSGGPDSMALCLLAAMWKRDAQKNSAVNNDTGFVDGILAIVVDHALRSGSGDEARLVSSRVENMGVKCEVVRCEWTDGRPNVGHLQEAARDKRYDLLQNVSLRHKIGVLLIAHHADDQAELFVIRLSRGSGVVGLAGMAFMSQIFPKWFNSSLESVPGHGMLLVRPLLEFSKKDMYKVWMLLNLSRRQSGMG